MTCTTWIFHDWEKWEQYEQQFTALLYPGELIQQEVERRRIREKRRCATCGKMQDRIVAELHAK